MTLADLNNHKGLEEKLIKAEELYKTLELAAYPKSPSLDGMPRSSGNNDKVAVLATELADLSIRIEFLEKNVKDSRPDIEGFINSITDDVLRICFRLRFIKALPWCEVAGILGGGNSEQSVKMMVYRYLDGR